MEIRDRKFTFTPTVLRNNVAAADTGDISSGTSKQELTTGVHEMVIVEFTTASATASIALALFNTAGTFYGVTEAQLFTADSSWINGAAGPYVSPVGVFDVMGAKYIYPIVKSLSAGTIDIYCVDLDLE
jgi:hypothetical protein